MSRLKPTIVSVSLRAAALAALLVALQPAVAQAQSAEQVQETRKARADKAAQLRAERAAKKTGATPAVEAALAAADAAQLSAAELVHYGMYECEFNQRLEVKLSPRAPGYVQVLGVGHDFTMKPIASPTGAIRLEDVKNIGLMLQIASKSMLMNLKTGQRMIDACVHPKHLGAAEVKN